MPLYLAKEVFKFEKHYSTQCCCVQVLDLAFEGTFQTFSSFDTIERIFSLQNPLRFSKIFSKVVVCLFTMEIFGAKS